MGTIFAHDDKQHAKWRRAKPKAKSQRGLTGHALEAAVIRIASIFPDNVMTGGAA